MLLTSIEQVQRKNCKQPKKWLQWACLLQSTRTSMSWWSMSTLENQWNSESSKGRSRMNMPTRKDSKWRINQSKWIGQLLSAHKVSSHHSRSKVTRHNLLTCTRKVILALTLALGVASPNPDSSQSLAMPLQWVLNWRRVAISSIPFRRTFRKEINCSWMRLLA